MKGKHHKAVPKGKKSSVIGRALAELRRSSASGTHGKKRKDRHNTERNAIREDQES
jgi:hypothetical protein